MSINKGKPPRKKATRKKPKDDVIDQDASLAVEQLLEWLQVTETGPSYREERVELMDAIINSFNLQFGIPVTEYSPEFLRWLYFHELWDRLGPAAPFWAFFYYVHEGMNGWPLLSMFLSYLSGKSILDTVPEHQWKEIQREVSDRFGKDGRLKSLITRVIQTAGRKVDTETIFRLFRKYCNGNYCYIPPWREADWERFDEYADIIYEVSDEMGAQDIAYLGPDLEWMTLHGTEIWTRVEEEAIALTAYYTHSIRKQGTPAELAEWEFIQKQFRGYELINPAWFDWDRLTIPPGAPQMEYCLQVIREQVDVLIFTEFQGYIGRGVWLEVQEARTKAIPIFLLRGQLLYLNPTLQVQDESSWAIHYAKVTVLPFDPISNLKEMIEV